MVISGVMSDEAGGSTYSVTVIGVSLQGDQMARAAHGSPVKWTSFKGQPEHNRACHDWIFTGLGLSFEYRGQFFFILLATPRVVQYCGAGKRSRDLGWLLAATSVLGAGH
jgi:hypothetical protein